jgi:RNA polymerase sigma-70 factor (ECF subfamily)
MNGVPLAPALPVALPANPADRLASLFDAHYDRLYRLARRLASSADDARDLVQETYLKAARSLGSVPHGSTNEEAWLVRVLVNSRRDQWRASAVRRRHDRKLSRGSRPDSGMEAALIARSLVWRALDGRPPRRRAVVVMQELEGLTTADLASVLGITAVTVRGHLSMGRRELGRALKSRMGGTDGNC